MKKRILGLILIVLCLVSCSAPGTPFFAPVGWQPEQDTYRNNTRIVFREIPTEEKELSAEMMKQLKTELPLAQQSV